jgi:hypothetical protein
VNLSVFYSYRLIGKLTTFLQLQEFCQSNQIVDSSTTSVCAKAVTLCINLNLDGAPIPSKSHTHPVPEQPSVSETSRFLRFSF